MGEVAIRLRITSDTRKTDEWVKGHGSNKVTFSARVFDKGSVYGIDNGRVSKLFICKDNKIIVNYDRGWDVKPENTEHQAIYKAVMNKLNHLSLVHEQDNGGNGSLLNKLDANKRKVAENDATQTFSAEITETLQKTVDVRAKNAEEAEALVRAAYKREEHVLDESNFVDVEFSTTEKTPEHGHKRGGEAI